MNKYEDYNPCWFVGATFGGEDDQFERFIKEGIWENGYDDKLLNVVKSIRKGEHIAIKSTYIRKRNLSFDNRERPVSVMKIKAIGIVTDNPKDGKFLKVDWRKIDPQREWFFFTGRNTIWKITPTDWKRKGLIDFTFYNEEQDIKRFLNAPEYNIKNEDNTDMSVLSAYTTVESCYSLL